MLNINRQIVLVLLIITSLLTGCVEDKASSPRKTTKPEFGNTQEYTIKNAYPIQFKVGEQEFQIVPVLKPILKYIQEVKETPGASQKELYLSTVVEPFRKETFGENGALWLKDQYNFEAPLSIDRLNESIILLDKDYEHFSLLIKESLEKSSKLLHGGTTTIYLFPFNPDQHTLIKQMSGVSAFTTSNQSNKIIILQIAPQEYKDEMIKYDLAHEYHHTVYLEKRNTEKRDLFEYLLTEGKADSFAKKVYPDVNIPWAEELSPNEEQTIWNWVKERRYTYTKNDIAEMNAGYGDIPKWSDYRIGYQILQEFLKKNPDVPINEWTFMNADEILQKSHFADKIQ